jgi:geranylgeranyl diphosphate synthase type I
VTPSRTATQREHDCTHEFRRRVDERLALFFEHVIVETERDAREAMPAIAQIQSLTMRGGKRLRPLLIVAAVECVTPWETLRAATLDVCAAIELLQTYLLIHDDWMDRALTRRGGVAVHVALQKDYGATGEHLAILAGNFASSLSQSLLTSEQVPSARVHDLMRVYTALQRELMLGQTLDLLGSDRFDLMHDLKTGSYTVRGPLSLGHALAGGGEPPLRALLAYGTPLGIAFQLRDDLLGVFGEARDTGKGTAIDLTRGKRTAPVCVALERFSPAQRTAFLSLIESAGDGAAGAEAAAAEAAQMMESVGARQVIEARIATHCEQAIRVVETAPFRAEGRELLFALAHQLTTRSG